MPVFYWACNLKLSTRTLFSPFYFHPPLPPLLFLQTLLTFQVILEHENCPHCCLESKWPVVLDLSWMSLTCPRSVPLQGTEKKAIPYTSLTLNPIVDFQCSLLKRESISIQFGKGWVLGVFSTLQLLSFQILFFLFCWVKAVSSIIQAGILNCSAPRLLLGFYSLLSYSLYPRSVNDPQHHSPVPQFRLVQTSYLPPVCYFPASATSLAFLQIIWIRCLVLFQPPLLSTIPNAMHFWRVTY